MASGDSSRVMSYSSASSDLHGKKPVLNYLIILLVLATLVVSIFALVNTYQLKKAVIPSTISPEEFLKKLTSHPETKSFVGVAPLNIVQINTNNLANLQSQISGLDSSYLGNFIIQYTDRIVVYDYSNDKIKGSVALQQPQKSQLPADFLTKLDRHPELQGLASEQPIGGQLDAASLGTLQQQFPDVYKNAKVGDFLLRYKTRLIIYDYAADKIVNAINLQ